MLCKTSLLFSIVTLLLACFIQSTFAAAAGWCYQCDSRDDGCQLDVDEVRLATHKAPCNGQCYIRVFEGRLSRGCSWEHGFMAKKPSYVPTFEKDSMWIFCDTPLCNARSNVSR